MAEQETEVKRDQKVTLACDCNFNGKHVKKGDTIELSKNEKAIFESHGWIEKEGK